MTRQLDHAYPTLKGDVMPGPAVPQEHRVRSNIRMTMVNTMRVPVFWRNALGIIVTEPPAVSTSQAEGFYVTISYELDRGSKVDTRELLNDIGLPEQHVERKRIEQRLDEIERNPTYKPKTFHYTLAISAVQLEDAGGILYMNDVDLVIGFESLKAEAIHPYSVPGQRNAVNQTLDIKDGIQQQYLLVDNSGIHGNRWINTGYGVFELRAYNNPALTDGVYVTTCDCRQLEPKTQFYTFDEADKVLGLYLNRAEAEAFGAPDERFKAELRELERDLQRDKAEAARIKQEAEREKYRLDEERRQREERYKQEDEERRRHQQIEDERRRREQEDRERENNRLRDELERDRERFKAERERQKFEYDMRQYDRKDISDTMKTTLELGKAMLGIVSLGLSLYVLIQKNQKT